jgi:hypothetical protein
MPEPPQQTPTVEAVMSPDGVFSLYSNHVGLSGNASDVRIMFGELLDVSPGKVKVLQRAHVLVSWLQVKAIARLLQDYVDSYENLNGPIMPPRLEPVIATDPFALKK